MPSSTGTRSGVEIAGIFMAPILAFLAVALVVSLCGCGTLGQPSVTDARTYFVTIGSTAIEGGAANGSAVSAPKGETKPSTSVPVTATVPTPTQQAALNGLAAAAQAADAAKAKEAAARIAEDAAKAAAEGRAGTPPGNTNGAPAETGTPQ